MNETSIHGELAVVEKHGTGDAVAEQVEGQFVLWRGALVTRCEEGEAHPPCGLVAQEGDVAADHRRSSLTRRPADHRVHPERAIETGAVKHEVRRRLVAVAGVTGVKEADADVVAPAVARVRAASGLPVAVGFGIKTPERAAAIARVADAVVVGSALVEEVAAAVAANEPAAPRVLAQVKALSDAVRSVASASVAETV